MKFSDTFLLRNRGLPVNYAVAKFENVWSDVIISDLILLYPFQPITTSHSVGTCQRSRSVALAKRITALGTRMGILYLIRLAAHE